MTQTPAAPKSPRGATLSCKGWPQEAALRLLLNSLDPEVAEQANEAPAGFATENLQPIVAALRELPAGQTLLVQPDELPRIFSVGVGGAPSVLIARPGGEGSHGTSMAIGNLHRFSQISAGSWFYVGNQSAVQASYEILGAAARRNFGTTLAGKLVLACGLGAVGGAQPLAATLHGAAALGVEPDSERIKHGVKHGYCEIMVNDLDEALRILKNSVRRHEPASVALLGNCGKVLSELASRGVVPDLLLPNFHERGSAAHPSAGDETLAMAELQNMGTVLLDGETFDPQLAEARQALTCIALSGSQADIARTDRLLMELFPANEPLQLWLPLAKKHVRFQGLPARVVWLSAVEHSHFATAINDLVLLGEFQAPVVLAIATFRGATEMGGRNAEAIVKIAGDKAAGAFLEAIEISSRTFAFQEVAHAIVADGTALTARHFKHTFGSEPAQEGGGDAS